ncbi:GIY-YIG nuclease family protein [Ignavigranum ruoffiae]|uniref:Putative endonuclease n=1 Tax=Ignavigranum ruoffiae TaxID=89093 RepID=A0A1H9BLB4_9LACT|nr:GIY-YIG nuclease family protein [Ignavigranum ruoffiae]SEP89168.1 putative endonuclease [Ignavigranum ruoffiae]
MVEKGHYFYVLYCKDDSLYAGYTNDLEQRLATHNAGQGAKYTRPKSRRPLKLIYAELWPSQRQAMQQEYRFKQFRRLKKEAYLNQYRCRPLSDKEFILRNWKELGLSADSTEL